MADGTPTRPGPAARVLVDERLLDAMLRRMRTTPAFTEGISLRVSDPALGAVAAELELAIASTRVVLARADHGRARAHVLMEGRVKWDLGLTQVSQGVDVRFQVLVRPWVVLRDTTTVELGVDLGDAKVRNVDVTLHPMTSLPIGRTSDLFGPVGRRALDRISGEAIRQFLRRLGRRELALESPIAHWLTLVGARVGRVAVAVHDGLWEMRFDADEDWGWDPPPIHPAGGSGGGVRGGSEVGDGAEGGGGGGAGVGGEDEERPGSIVVDVDPTRAASLVQHWLGGLAVAGEQYRLAALTPGDDDDPAVALDVVLDRSLPGPLPDLAVPVAVQVLPRIGDARIAFGLDALEIPIRFGGPWLSGVAARFLARRLAPRLVIPGRWDLPLPFGEGQGWLVGVHTITIRDASARVVLDSWFSPV